METGFNNGVLEFSFTISKFLYNPISGVDRGSYGLSKTGNQLLTVSNRTENNNYSGIKSIITICSLKSLVSFYI